MPRSLDAFAAEAPASAPLVALIVEGADWHARVLTQAFAALGVRIRCVELRACAIDTQRPAGLAIAGFGDRLPDAALVRTMSGGTFQAVTLRLGILHALRENGVLVWNDARAIERCVDKSTTSFLLARAGIPTPATWAVESRDAARAIVQRESARGPLVLKPLFGSQGRGLRLLRSEDDVPAPDAVTGVYYLQRFVGVEAADGFRDFRLLVSRGRVVAAMTRQAASWITNVKQGGRPMAVVAGNDLKELAVRAAAVVGANFAGVDILYGADGQPSVLEVNSMPAWSGLQKVSRARIAVALADDLVAALAGHARRGARV
jgi:tetrahydromethanopterin:alpha-L-glutamate ligase